MSSCSITFHNNPQAVFYGGQVLSGTAVLTTVKQKTIRAIYIEILGYGKVSFTDSNSRRRWDGRTEYRTETYMAMAQYLTSKKCVLGNELSEPFELPPGTYTYNFQTPLPFELPSTVEGEHGHVRYEAVLVIDRPWKYHNIFKTRFTVIQTLNLNMDPKYKNPIETQDVHSTCCGCCCCCCGGSEVCTLKCRVPLSGYAPGQKIPFTILVENESTVEYSAIRIKLDKILKFKATDPYRKERETTSTAESKSFGSVPKLCNKEFKDFLQLPALPSTSVVPGHIIEVSYMVTVAAVPKGCHCNPTVTFPITIGTVPLLESAENFSNIVTTQPTAPQLSFDGDSPPPYFENAPPAYEAVTTKEKFMSDEEDDKYIHKEPFAPKYPVYYNFGSQSAPPIQMNPASAPPLSTGPAMPALPTMSVLAPMPVQSSSPTMPTSNNTVHYIPPSQGTIGTHGDYGNERRSPDIDIGALRIIPEIIDLIVD